MTSLNMSSLFFLSNREVNFLKEEVQINKNQKKISSHTPTSIYTALYLGLKLYWFDWVLRKVKYFDLATQEFSKCSFQAISLNSNTVMTGWITVFSTFLGVFTFYMLSAFQKYLCQTSQIWNKCIFIVYSGVCDVTQALTGNLFSPSRKTWVVNI